MNIESFVLSLMKVVVALLPVLSIAILIRRIIKNRYHFFTILSLSYIIFLFVIVLLANIATILCISVNILYMVFYVLSVFVLIYEFIKHRKRIVGEFSRYTKSIFSNILIIFVFFFTAVISWYSALQTHPIDGGTHILWSTYAYETGKIPNYKIVEPLDQSSKFVYGTHMFLTYLYNLTIDPFKDIKAVKFFISFLTVLFMYSLLYQLTNNKLLSIIATVTYVLNFITGGYIQRGNIPDIIGESIVISLISLILLLNELKTKLYIIIAGIFLLMTFHPYHLLIFVTSLFIYTLLMFFIYVNVTKRDIICHVKVLSYIKQLKLLFLNKYTLLFFIIFTFYGYTSYIFLPYLHTGINEVSKINWSHYVPSLESIAKTQAFLFPLGISVSFLSILLIYIIQNMFYLARYKNLLLISSWYLSTIVLSQLARFGIGIEPIRFVWRGLEPLIILVTFSFSIIITFYKHKSNTFYYISYIMLLLALVFSSVFIPNNFLDIYRYSVDEPYYKFYKDISNYIKSNFDTTQVVLIADAERDRSATYLQAYSGVLRALYRADYAIRVAPYPYNLTYYMLHIIYTLPLNDTRVYNYLAYIGNIYNVSNILIVYYDKDRFYKYASSEFYELLVSFEDPSSNIWIAIIRPKIKVT